MKKEYEKPCMEIQTFSVEDITTSTPESEPLPDGDGWDQG